MEIYTTGVLTGVVNSLKMPPRFLLDRYFPRVISETSEEIHFDVIKRTRRLAPLVSPLKAGRVVQSEGFTTKTFKPAYLKPKTPFSPARAIVRAPGEPIGGALSPQQRIEALIRQDLFDHRDQIDRRLELMAAEALVNGSITVSGEDYPTTVVDFDRDGDLTVTPDTDWDAGSGVNILGDLQEWSGLGLKAEGAALTDVIMPVDVWALFRADTDVQKRLDTKYLTENAMSLSAPRAEGGDYKGTVDGFNIIVYSGWYIDDNGDEQPILPAGKLVMTSPALEGARQFGAILDHDSLQAVPYFAKTWVDQDPSVRYLMTQSAPLVVPRRVNASLVATVYS